MNFSEKRSQARQDKGFTLIELLVVVVIIGVLIAIAIPLYLNYRKGAENKSAQTDARNAVAALEQCYSDNNGVYPASVDTTTSTTTTIKFLVGTVDCTTSVNLSSGTAFRYHTVTSGYGVEATHGTNGTYYCYVSTSAGSVAAQKTACW